MLCLLFDDVVTHISTVFKLDLRPTDTETEGSASSLERVASEECLLPFPFTCTGERLVGVTSPSGVVGVVFVAGVSVTS